MIIISLLHLGIEALQSGQKPRNRLRWGLRQRSLDPSPTLVPGVDLVLDEGEIAVHLVPEGRLGQAAIRMDGVNLCHFQGDEPVAEQRESRASVRAGPPLPLSLLTREGPPGVHQGARRRDSHVSAEGRRTAPRLPFQNPGWGGSRQQEGRAAGCWSQVNGQVVYPQQPEGRGGHLGKGPVPLRPPWTLTHALSGR